MSKESLKSITLHALSWSFTEAVGLQLMKFVIGILLARLLFPEQFGLIAMLSVFIAVANAFIESGFGAALIQKRSATQIDHCSIFYFNIVVGLVASGILYMSAPFIATFYGQPTLTPIARAMSLIIVINSFGLIQGSILAKQIDFKTQAKVSLLAGSLSGLIGIVLAVAGFGVWSLVVQQVSLSFFQTVFLWFFNPWRPSFLFSVQSLRNMFGFGSRLLASGLLNQVFDNLYYVVIGRLFSAGPLGFFTCAMALAELPSRTLSGMVARVTFPVFSAIQDDPVRLKICLRKALTFLVLVNSPVMIGMAVIAHPLVLVLLTEKWVACVPYLQLLCLMGLLYPLHLMNLNVLQALGRSDLFLRLEIIKKVLIVINIAVTWQYGIAAMIYGMIAFSGICYFLNSYYTGVLLRYPIGEQMRDMIAYLIMAGIMGGVVFLTGLFPFPNPLAAFIVQIIIGILVYACLCRMFRLEAFMSALEGCRMKAWLKGNTFV